MQGLPHVSRLKCEPYVVRAGAEWGTWQSKECHQPGNMYTSIGVQPRHHLEVGWALQLLLVANQMEGCYAEGELNEWQ